MKKACKVVTTYFGNRRFYPTNAAQTLDLFHKMLSKEKTTDAGIECDTILVNHLLKDGSDGEGVDLLDSLNGTKLINGALIVMHRPYDNGTGFGFKSRDYAFKKYQLEYDYWFFVEDDLNFFHDNYLKHCVEVLDGDKDVAFVATLHNLAERPVPHANGGIGCTHRRFLTEVIKASGKLPYPNSSNYRDAELGGEVPSTSIFLDMGYKLRRLLINVHDTTYWADYHLNVSRVSTKNSYKDCVEVYYQDGQPV